MRSGRCGSATSHGGCCKRYAGSGWWNCRYREQCCGFGGTFAIKNPDVSAAMASEKIRYVLDTQAEVCTGVDNSCLMHIGGALSRQRAGVRCLHIAEILGAASGGQA